MQLLICSCDCVCVCHQEWRFSLGMTVIGTVVHSPRDTLVSQQLHLTDSCLPSRRGRGDRAATVSEGMGKWKRLYLSVKVWDGCYIAAVKYDNWKIVMKIMSPLLFPPLWKCKPSVRYVSVSVLGCWGQCRAVTGPWEIR